MKYLIILILLFGSPAAHASWFSWHTDSNPEYREKVTALESELSAQRSTSSHWQIATGTLGVGCVLLFVIGTALGSETRQHHHATRRLGTSINNRQPHILGEAAEEQGHSTMAA